MNFLPRFVPQDSAPDPVDLTAVHSDDALIEMLRAGGGSARPSRHLAPELRQAVAPRSDPRSSHSGYDEFGYQRSGDGDLFDLGAAGRPDAGVGPTGPIDLSAAAAGGSAGDAVVAFGPTGRHRVERESHSADPLTSLLVAWKAELASAPLPEPISITEAVAIVRSAPAPRRSLRPVMAIAVAIFALLMGSAAVGSRSATPGDMLWPVTQLLWSDRADSVIAGRDARQGIDSASAAIVAGHPEAAVVALESVTVILTKVQEQDGRVTLESDYQRVSAQLESMAPESSSKAPAPTTGQASTNTNTTAPAGTTPATADSGSPSVIAPPTEASTPTPTTTTTTITPTTKPTTPSTPTTPTTSSPITTPVTPSSPDVPPVTTEVVPPVDTGTTGTTQTEVTTLPTTEESPAGSPADEQNGQLQQPNNSAQQADQQASN